MTIVNHDDVFSGGNQSEKLEIQLATIAPGYVDGRPQVVFYGESLASIKRYCYLESYAPSAGDRVMLLKGVIIGKIV